MRGFRIAAMLALSLTYPSPARAQRGHALEAGLLTEFEEATFLLGYRLTNANLGRVGLDFSVSTLPQAWSEAFIGLLHLDLTTPIAVGPRAWLLPRAGVSGIVAAGAEIGGAAPGFNIGIGLVGRLGERTGVRLDVTHMRLIGDDETAGITGLTFGFQWFK